MSSPATIENVKAPSVAPLRRSLVLPFDPFILLATLGLAACSLATLGKATGGGGGFVTRQAVFFAVGLLLATLLSRMDYSRLREMTWGLYGFLILSILAVFVLGSSALGAQRSIALPGFSFQASELGKVLLCIVLAGFLTGRAREIGSPAVTFRAVLLTLVPAALVVIQPDLGSGLVYIAILIATLFIAGVPMRHFAVLAGLAAIAIAVVLIALPAAGVEVLHGYQKDRLTSFLHPSESVSGEAYQQVQSIVAIGAGEKVGRGDDATQTRLDFLPESHTDFVFGVVGETWGFAGAAVVLALYAMLIWRGLRLITMAKNLFGSILAGGIVAMLTYQVFVNVGMTIGIMPITGIPLPLMSYGGSSVITTLLAVGLLQSIAAQSRASTAPKGRLHSNL